MAGDRGSIEHARSTVLRLRHLAQDELESLANVDLEKLTPKERESVEINTKILQSIIAETEPSQVRSAELAEICSILEFVRAITSDRFAGLH